MLFPVYEDSKVLAPLEIQVKNYRTFWNYEKIILGLFRPQQSIFTIFSNDVYTLVFPGLFTNSSATSRLLVIPELKWKCSKYCFMNSNFGGLISFDYKMFSITLRSNEFLAISCSYASCFMFLLKNSRLFTVFLFGLFCHRIQLHYEFSIQLIISINL